MYKYKQKTYDKNENANKITYENTHEKHTKMHMRKRKPCLQMQHAIRVDLLTLQQTLGGLISNISHCYFDRKV